MTSLTALVSTTVAGNPAWRWLAFAAATAAAFLLLRSLRDAVASKAGALSARTANHLDDLVAAAVRRTHPVFLLALSVLCGSLLLTSRLNERLFGQALVVVGVIQAGLWVSALSTGYLAVLRDEKKDGSAGVAMGAIGFVARIAIWSVVTLLALENLGVNVTALVAGLGVGGIAVALAAQNLLGDLFASASIALDRPFEIGDFIVVGDMMGTVESVGLKTTRVRSLSGEQIIFSNAELLSSRIQNFKRMLERRVVFSFGIVYETPYEKLAAVPHLVRQIVESQEGVRFDRAHFQKYGASSLDFEVVYYVLSPDYNRYMDVQQAVNLAIFERFAAEHIGFAYPTQTVYLTRTREE